MHVRGAGNVRELVGHLLRQLVVLRLVLAHKLNVNRRGKPEVQDLRDDVRRLEEEFNARKLPRQFFAQLLHIVVGRMMVLLVERKQNLSVRCADRCRRCCKNC